jgi:predicted 3-demethylubiquinone-9 3-methyltransferase (glyoxalase superfamily)
MHRMTWIQMEGSKPVQKITPHLWFDKEAREAAELYTSILDDSRIKNTAMLHNTPSGKVRTPDLAQ